MDINPDDVEKSGLSQLSIKTRIETQVWPEYIWFFLCLSQLSIKTRIETPPSLETSEACILVWVSYPLKQGLKHKEQNMKANLETVWVSYPLKQGLKRQ